jgi:sugar lactone lactonase YvrE
VFVLSGDTLQWNPIGITLIGNGSNGSSLSQLNGPAGVFIDAYDVIYIADSNNHRVLKLSVSSGANGTNIGIVAAGITNVSTFGSDTLNTPTAVFVDSQQNLYIVDTDNYRVQLFPYGVSNGSTVAGSSTRVAGSTLDKLGASYALYVDTANNVYVSDGSNGRVVKWSLGASSGILVAGNGSSGYTSSQLNFPLGIIVASQSNTIYIADYGVQTVVTWPSGMTVGTIVAGLNSTLGNIPSLLDRPWGIISDIYGNLYVGDSANHRIQQFCAIGSSFSSGTTIAGIGVAQLSSRGLNLPTSIAFDSQMNLYVTDYYNHRVQKFVRTN